MAYVGKVSIRDTSHMENAIDYITREEKALPLTEYKDKLKSHMIHIQDVNQSDGERATYINCNSLNAFKEFENMRRAFDQDKGVIAHHYYQSFQKDDDVNPEQAHKIGVELAKKMFPDYQVVVATHIDREHQHNHIIVNSCNIVTGQKWYSNKKSLSDIRAESDKLCLQNGLSIIDKKSKYKTIDKTTYQLGVKGKSWKVQLIKDLDDAVIKCRSKEEFINFFKERDYDVKYKDVHITITKIGQEKGIRVNTLAKQFGDKYTKENLEKLMGYYKSPDLDKIFEMYSFKKKKNQIEYKSNWEYYERKTFRQRKYHKSNMNRIISDNQSEVFMRKINSIGYSRNIFEMIIKALIFMTMNKNYEKKSRYRKSYKVAYKFSKPQEIHYNQFGNIAYKKLMGSAGENFTIKVSTAELLKLVNQPIFYSAVVNRNDASAEITVKNKDKLFLAKLLGLENLKNDLEAQDRILSNKIMYSNLKKEVSVSGEKLQYLLITEEQLKVLQKNYIPIAYFNKEDKYNIAFTQDNLKVIRKLISKENPETESQRNMKIYNKLKTEAAKNGEKLAYRAKLSGEQVQKLKEANIEFAYFVNAATGTFNIAFDKKAENRIQDILYMKGEKKQSKGMNGE